MQPPPFAKNWNKLTDAEKQAWYDSIDRLRRAAKADRAFYFQAIVTPDAILTERILNAVKILTEV